MSIAGRKITPASAVGEQIIFNPANGEEAVRLQEKLFHAGFAWADGSKTVQAVGDAVKEGIVVMGGRIYTRGIDDDTPYIPCSIQQLDDDFLSSEQKLLVEMFAKVNDRLDRIEQRLDRLEDGGPALDKPHSLKPPQTRIRGTEP